MIRRFALLLALAGCETDDFFISDGGDGCPGESTDSEAEAAPTTSSVMTEPLAEITTGPDTTGPATPPDPTLPGLAPAQERP
jgi:hypothetical protein